MKKRLSTMMELFMILLTGIAFSDEEPKALPDIITIPLPEFPRDAKPLTMVLIPNGIFNMGSPNDEKGRTEKEWPPHQVTIRKPFYIGKYEVTQAQWSAVMGCYWKLNKVNMGNDYPVCKRSWNQYHVFIRKLNQLNLGTFRFPTEAEWEYACRAGTNTRFSFGDSLDDADQYMWWSGNNQPKYAKKVGLKKPNPWGLYDMHGNISEWCGTRWQKPKKRKAQVDPQGPEWGLNDIPWSNYVFKGGSFMREAKYCRAAYRSFEQQMDFHYSLGIRLVMECDEKLTQYIDKNEETLNQ